MIKMLLIFFELLNHGIINLASFVLLLSFAALQTFLFFALANLTLIECFSVTILA